MNSGAIPTGRATHEPSPTNGLGHAVGVPIAISREAMREQKAVRTFLLVRAARALIRSGGTSFWKPWERTQARWIASAYADAAHCLERSEHHAEQAEWLSPLEPAFDEVDCHVLAQDVADNWGHPEDRSVAYQAAAEAIKAVLTAQGGVTRTGGDAAGGSVAEGHSTRSGGCAHD